MGWVTAIGGIASAVLGKKSADKAAEKSMLGYEYLLGNEAVQGVQQQATAGTGAINTALGLGAGMNFGESMAYDKLIAGPDLSEEAFSNFRESTGYDFRKQEGMGAITGSAAARGLLNSGSAAKSLQAFGQNLASDEYSRFFSQQRGIQQDEQQGFINYLTALQQQQQTGLSAAYNTASQGASAGQGAGQYIMQGGQEIASGLGVAAGGVSDMYYNGGFKNPFARAS